MEKIGDFLKKLLDRNEVTLNNSYSSFFKSWDKIAGEPLSAYSKVIDISRNQLIVQVDHPGWMQMFQFKERKILKEIQKNYPELKIKALKLVLIDKKSEKEKKKAKSSDTINKIEKEVFHFKKQDKEMFNDIADNELKNKLQKLYSTVVKNSNKDK